MKYYSSTFGILRTTLLFSFLFVSVAAYAAVTITTPTVTSGELIEAADWNRIRTDLQNLSTEVDGIASGTSVWSTNAGNIYRVSGNIGIGTTVPATDLNIVTSGNPIVRVTAGSNLDSSLQLLELNNSPQFGAEIMYEGNDNKLHIGMFADSSIRTNAIVIPRANSNVGIGGQIDPTHPLHVGGNTRIDGNLGVGIDSSSFSLEVEGGARKSVGGKNWSTSSDIRLKNILGSYDLGLEAVLALNPVVFEYKEGNARNLPTQAKQYGFIAQEVALILPEAVKEDPVDGYLNLNTSSLELALVNAVKALNAQNQELRKELEALKELLK